MHAFEETIRATASKQTPWYVVPADNKWFTRLVVAAAIVEAVEELNLTYPKSTRRRRRSWRLRVRSLPTRPHETSADRQGLAQLLSGRRCWKCEQGAARFLGVQS
jgi:Polyphosphate kinase 2 (PPK2)